MTDDKSLLRFEHAKKRMAVSIALVWRHHSDDGELMLAENLREDFVEMTAEIESLSALWAFISQPLQQRVRNMIENPAVGFHFEDDTSWQSYDRMVLGYLEHGEHLAFAEIEKRS